MGDTPALDAEKTTPPPGGGETIPPVAETETISKAELAKLRMKVDYSLRKDAELEAARERLAGYEQTERINKVAQAHGLDPAIIEKVASKMNDAELEEFVALLPKSGEKPGQQPMKPYSGKTDGGARDFSKMTPDEKIAYGLSHKK